MNDRYAKHLAELRARHAEDLDILKRVLAGRRPGLLRTLGEYQAGVERETARILMLIERRKANHESEGAS